MRHRAMFDSQAFRSIRPRNRRDRKSVLVIAACLAFAVAFTAGFLYNKHHEQTRHAREWMSALAILEDARVHLVMQSDSQRGGGMLYEVQVLARYRVEGVNKETWTTIAQLPKPLSDAQLQIYLVKNKQCVVRWKPNDPSHITAEIN